mgnify:CR=1 FL=1
MSPLFKVGYTSYKIDENRRYAIIGSRSYLFLNFHYIIVFDEMTVVFGKCGNKSKLNAVSFAFTPDFSRGAKRESRFKNFAKNGDFDGKLSNRRKFVKFCIKI